jgi:hypothetical protein
MNQNPEALELSNNSPCTQNGDTQIRDTQNETLILTDLKINNSNIKKQQHKKVVVDYTQEEISLKEKITETLKTEVPTKKVKSWIAKYGMERINFYIKNWNAFDCTAKNNPVGFFACAIKEQYQIPQAQPASGRVGDNMKNYEEREIQEGEFDKYYFKVDADNS